MPLWHRMSSLVFLLIFLLCVCSVNTSIIGRQFAIGKDFSIAAKLPHGRPFAQSLRESVRLGLPEDADRERENDANPAEGTGGVQTTRSHAALRQSDDGNFVIFVSSQRKNGHIVSIPGTPDKDNRQSENDKKSQSSNTESVTILGTQPTASGSDHEDTSNGLNNTNSRPRDLTTNTSSPTGPIPEADVYLDVTTGNGNPNDSILIQPEPEPEVKTPESTFDVDITVIDPSSEETLTSADGPSAFLTNDGGDGSGLDKESNSNHVIPQPSVVPGPKVQPVILIPPDTEDGGNSPGPEDIDDNILVESPIPASGSAVESPEYTEAIPELAESPEFQNINATSPSRAEKKPSSPLKEGPPRPGGAKGSATILVDVPLSVSSSERSISPKFDSHARNYLGKTTGTTAGKWKPTKMSTTVRTIQQRRKEYRWTITYQGKLSEATARNRVDRLEKDINTGAMDTYLEERMSTKVTVRTSSTPLVDAPEGNELSLTETKENPSGTTNSEEEGGRNSLSIILGTCFGLLGALVLVAAAFIFVRRRKGNERHILDGMATVPTTISSFQSDMSESEVPTGAPTKPRGATVLRNQSRILDWQMDYARGSDEIRRIG